MPKKKTLHFKTNVQLKSIIGKDLINDDNIAILELVKNSFDADAKKVIVKYLNLKKNDDKSVTDYSDETSRLIIQDDGTGMTEDEVENKWLNIAYSEKKSVKRKHNRRMAGAKGVGRFSCDRLGKYLNLYTKTKDDEQYLKLSIDWKEFEVEDENKEIQSINLTSETLSKNQIKSCGIDVFNHGVTLEIIKLRSTWVYPIKDDRRINRWNVEKFVTLKQYLEKLINPNQAFTADDFGIHIKAPEFVHENEQLANSQKFIGQVKNRIFEKLDFKTTSVETYTQESGKEIRTELKDKGKTIFWVLENNPFYPEIKNVRVTAYYLNTYAKSFFTKQTGIRSVDYGSVFLFINGFRIPPYGEPGNDWLGLDRRKAQGVRRYIGSKEVIGHIEIWDDENQFQIITSREGVVKNDSYHKLIDSDRNNSFFFRAFRRLERYVVDGLNWDSSIYQTPKELTEIEAKIVSGQIKDEELVYREDEKSKQLRVYNTIHSIIGARFNEVKQIYINEDLITEKISEEKEKSEKEFTQ
ncbi:MAG: ATP-binding protein, partial [Allomuricauda sp.]